MPERLDQLEVAIGDDGTVYVGEEPVPEGSIAVPDDDREEARVAASR